MERHLENRLGESAPASAGGDPVTISYRATMLRLTLVRGAAVLLLTGSAAIGCEDRITGPEAVGIVEALESGFRSDSLMRRMYLSEAMGGWSNVLSPLWNNSAATTQLVVRRDGEPVEYRAIVFERVVVPPAGADTADRCAYAPRRSLLLWRFGDPTEGAVFTGGEFDRPLGPAAGYCRNSGLPDPRPVLWMVRLPPDSSAGVGARDVIQWGAVAGVGDISPAEEEGDCGFSDDDARFLLEETGATCRRTSHRVRLRAQLRRSAQGRAPADPGTERFTLEVPVTEVVGVRYTIHCDERPELRPCRSPYDGSIRDPD